MPNKIALIASLVTLTLWLGQLTGCGSDQNYRVLEEDRPLFEESDRPIPGQPGAHAQPAAELIAAAQAQPESESIADPAAPADVAAPAEPVAPANVAEPVAPVSPAEPAAPTSVAAPTEPVAPVNQPQDPAVFQSVEPVEPVADEVMQGVEADELAAISETEPSIIDLDRSHWPVVVVTSADGRTAHWPIYFRDVPLWDQDRGVSAAEGTEERLAAALEGGDASALASQQWLGAVVQPLKFAFDLVTLPVKMVINPPWTVETTP